MPIYEFSCESCAHRFEELCSQSSSAQMRCPRCGAAAKRRISGFAFQSSGSSRGSGSGCSSCGGGSCTSCRH